MQIKVLIIGCHEKWHKAVHFKTVKIQFEEDPCLENPHSSTHARGGNFTWQQSQIIHSFSYIYG